MAYDLTRHTLNSIMELDHVIQVHEDGTVTDGPNGVYAPECVGDAYGDSPDESVKECARDHGWETFSDGYTGQYGYRGPIMHNSEFIGGALEEDILSTPGLYVACPVSYIDDPDTDENETYVEGWVVFRRDAE